MCTYLMRKEASRMIKERNTSSLVVMRTLKATSFTILLLGRQSSVEISYSMKKENGLWDNIINADYNVLLYFEEDDLEHPRIEKAREEPTTLPTSPTASTQEDGSSSERVPSFRSLQ